MTKSQHYSVAHVFEKLASKARALAVDRSGSTAVEYALVSGGIGTAISGGLSLVGSGITDIFETLDLVLCQQLQTFCFM